MHRAAVVHLNFPAGSTFPVPVCTVPSSMDRTGRCHKVDAVRLYASYRLNLLLLKMQRYVTGKDTVVFSSLKASKSNHSYKFFVDTFVDKPQLKIICFLNYKYCYHILGLRIVHFHLCMEDHQKLCLQSPLELFL